MQAAIIGIKVQTYMCCAVCYGYLFPVFGYKLSRWLRGLEKAPHPTPKKTPKENPETNGRKCPAKLAFTVVEIPALLILTQHGACLAE